MDVLYAGRLHVPVAEHGIQIQKSKKQKVIRTSNRRSSMSGIGDDGCSRISKNECPSDDEGRFSGVDHGISCVVLGGSTSTAGSPTVSYATALSPSTMTDGLPICVEREMNPSNHQCRKCDRIVCGVCCASKRGLEGTWWCGDCFNKRSAKIQKAIRDHEYFSDDDSNEKASFK